MKLDNEMVERTLAQFPARVIPADHPSASQLNSLFGDHTFFIDAHGLSILEPVSDNNSGKSAQVVQLAGWQDPQRTGLVPHEPRSTDVVVTLES